MERKTYLNRYRVSVDRLGLPFIIRRSADEAMFQADDVQSGRQVAVQVMPAAAFGAVERDQLAAEARAAQQIDHVNIPQLCDFGFEGDQLVYVTEYLEGTSAEDWIRDKGPMPLSAVLRIATQMVGGLVAAGLHGIVHYAVHPGNIMLAPGETAAGEWPLIKIINLLGVVPSVPLLGVSASLNPADFASPEQLEDRPVNFRSEIYSLGCTIWFLLKGAPLIGGAAALPATNGLSEPMRQLLAGMLAKNPAERPSDPLAIQQQIQNCHGLIERQDVAAKFGILPVTAPVTVQRQAQPRSQSAWRPVALAAIFLAIATLAVLILKQRLPQLFAGDATAAAVLTTPVLAPTAVQQKVEAAPTEEPAKPPTLALNVTTRPDESERPAPAPEALEDASVSSRREQTEQSDLPGENAEGSEPIVASNSSAPESQVAATETAPASLPSAAEPPPPAEGPRENEQPSAEIFSTPTGVAVEEKPEEDVLVIPTKVEPEKPAKPTTAAKSSKKKKPVAAVSRPTRRVYPEPPRSRDPVAVGHIFPPLVR